MNYQTFKGLYTEALSFDNVDEYVLHHDWSEWMDGYPENEVGPLLQTIYGMVNSDLKTIREKYGYSRAAFSRLFAIPIRTLENWDSGSRKMPDYVKTLICYALFEDRSLCAE